MSGITVVGGAGGTHARTEDLDQASHILASARDRIEGVAAWARSNSAEFADGPWGVGEVGDIASHVVEALDWVNAGAGGARATVSEIEEISCGLAETVALLEGAERGAGGLWDHVGATLGGAARREVAALGLASWLGAVAAPPWSPLSPGGPVSISPVPPPEPTALLDAGVIEAALGVGHAVAPVSALLGCSLTEFLTLMLALSATGWAQLLGGTRTLTIDEEETQIATPPSGAEDIVERIGALYPSSGGDGDVARVGIECIEHADGTRAWIVEIPGTQEFLSPGGPNPFDFVADVQMMAKMTSDVMVAVTVAMEEAGIAAGEAVMLGGHSLGGIAAMALASNESFSSRYSVTAVVTAGSPVARFAPIGGPSVLSLENSTDIVWAFDGAANPDRATWTTVHQDLRASDLAADRAAATSLVGSHEPATYARTAALFDASSASSARAWREQNEAFIADGTSTSTRTTYAITRSADQP